MKDWFDRYLGPILQLGRRIRWNTAGRLFQWYLLPRSVATIVAMSPLHALAYVTFGQVLVLLPLLALAGLGIRYSLIEPSPARSGHAAWYALVATVLLANKSSSALSILLGQSWERLVPYHHLAAYIAVLNSVLHGYAAYTHDGVVSDDAAAAPFLADSNYSSNNSNYTSSSSIFSSSNILDIIDHVSNSSTTPTASPSVQTYSGEEGANVRLDDYEDVLSPYSLHGDEPDLLAYLLDGAVNVSGTLMTVFMLLLVGSSTFRPAWRGRWFDLWLLFHVCCALDLAATSFVHALSEAKLIFSWWFIDVAIRHLLQPSRCCSPDAATLTLLLPDLVEIRFCNNTFFRFRSGQFLRIAVREVGMYEFHPATISSAPHENDVTVHFRVRGGWTERLALRAAATQTQPEQQQSDTMMSTPVQVRVAIQGPFGNLSMNVLDDAQRYPHVLLIGGGIGVTPLRSLVRHLLYAHQKLDQRRQQIHLVWVVSNVELVNALPILPEVDDDGDDEVIIDEVIDDTFFSPHRIMNKNNSKKHISQEMWIDNDTDDDDVPTKKSSRIISKYHHSDTVLLGIDDDDDDDGEVLTDREYYRDNEEPTDSMTSEPSSSSFSSEKWSDEVKTTARTGTTKDKNKALLQFDIYITHHGSSSSSSTSLPCPKSRSGVVDVHYHWGRRPDMPSIVAATASHVVMMTQQRHINNRSTAAFGSSSGHRPTTTTASTSSHVAVIACGPVQLVGAAKKAARSQSNAAVAFDFHEEVFEF